MSKLKICGLMTLHDIDCVNRAAVDFAGFVFTPHRQQINAETAKILRQALRPEIKAVGVFTDEPYAFIRRMADEKIIDCVQFHGDTEYKMPCPTIKAFRMNRESDIKPTGCDFVLFDAFKKGTRGSTGGMFDWRLIKNYDRSKPFFIAGGINAANVTDALALNPYCVDISSGAEENGAKSLKKIMEVSSCIKKYYQK